VEWGESRLKEVACGRFHTLVLSAEGRVYSMGSVNSGQTGHGTATGSLISPKLIEALKVCCHHNTIDAFD